MNDFLIVEVPPTLEQHKYLLEKFVESMVLKLHKNSHKETPTIKTVPEIIDLMMLEVDEFEEQFFENKDDPNALLELADVANFAFLAYFALRTQHAEVSLNSADGS
jgi:hypothetical protein